MSSKAMFQTEYRDGRMAFNVPDQGNCFQVPIVRKNFFKLMLPPTQVDIYVAIRPRLTSS
jgi:hypothetical protein